MRKKQFIFATMVFVMFYAIGGHAEVKNIYGVRFCNGVPVAVQGQSVTLSLSGPWVDHASNQSSVSGSGVTITRIYGRRAGNSPQVKLDIQVSANATPGNRVVTLQYPIDKDTFTLKIVARPRITRITKPTFSAPFKNNVVIGLRGSGLRNLRVIPRITTDQIKSLNATGQVVSQVQITKVEETRNTATNIDLRLTFDRALSQVHLALELKNDNACGGVFLTGGAIGQTNVPNRAVTLKAPVRPNFVKEITFPAQSAFRVGGSARFEVVLERPAAALTKPKLVGGAPAANPAGEVVYWKLVPADAFVSGATPYKTSGFNTLIIPNGRQSAEINVRIKKCPGNRRVGPAQSRLLTWRVKRNSNTPPEFREKEFTIGCN